MSCTGFFEQGNFIYLTGDQEVAFKTSNILFFSADQRNATYTFFISHIAGGWNLSIREIICFAYDLIDEPSFSGRFLRIIQITFSYQALYMRQYLTTWNLVIKNYEKSAIKKRFKKHSVTKSIEFSGKFWSHITEYTQVAGVNGTY